LYVLTSDSAAELKVYDITTPASLGAGNLVTSYDLPGAALGRALAVWRNELLIGAAYSAADGENELYAFDMGEGGTLTRVSAVNDDDSIQMIAVTGTSAYLASSLDTGELRIASISGTGGLTLLGGYNLSDRTLNGLSVAATGTSALLGTQKGGTQEMVLFDVGPGGIPVPPPGPWYHEGSGSLLQVGMDPTRCYAFLAADSGRKALQVILMQDKTNLPEVGVYNSASGLGRGLFYDPVHDRLYLLTTSGFLIFKPGDPPSDCA
jgi:hypothetical protein